MSTGCCEDVVLRVMKASDLPHVRALHRNLLPVSYPAAFFVQLLVNPRQLCLVATDRGAIVGFASAAMGPSQLSSVGGALGGTHTDRECSEAYSDIPRSRITLLTLGVLPAYQRRGTGRSLVHGVVQRLETSCAGATRLHRTAPPDHVVDQDSESKIPVLVQVQVAQSNSAGKRFYAHLGMIDQRGCDGVGFRLGPGSRTSFMAGVLCV